MRISEIIIESFDNSYPVKVIQSPDSDDYEAVAKLPDGTSMEIMFSEYGGVWDMEFHRGGTTAQTGEGDAFRVFATMIEAVKQFIQMEKPYMVSFSASKEAGDVEVGNTESRAKLYNRLVDRFATKMGYNALINDYGSTVEYELINPKRKSVDENFADGKVKGKSRPGRVKKAGASCKGSVTDLRAKAKKYSGEKGKMYHWCANMKSGKKK